MSVAIVANDEHSDTTRDVADNVLGAVQNSVDFLTSCAFSLSVNLIPSLFFYPL